MAHISCKCTPEGLENVETHANQSGFVSCFQCEDAVPSSQEGAGEAGAEDRVDVRYLQWLNGRLRLQWRALHAQHQEHCKLLHKVNDSFNSLWHSLLFKSLVS